MWIDYSDADSLENNTNLLQRPEPFTATTFLHDQRVILDLNRKKNFIFMAP